ncbi:hypothetical protein [Tautonia rosea]|uniref:hypothetical protein n=1 Tax=Tautonia rosea TaxID=2728037 RepID=UPI00147586E3|nr:hypothetical protein [Tautonia rosea]
MTLTLGVATWPKPMTSRALPDFCRSAATRSLRASAASRGVEAKGDRLARAVRGHPAGHNPIARRLTEA